MFDETVKLTGLENVTEIVSGCDAAPETTTTNKRLEFKTEQLEAVLEQTEVAVQNLTEQVKVEMKLLPLRVIVLPM